MNTPSLLRALTRRVDPRWQERVRRIRKSYVLIWNPILNCHAVVGKGLADQRLEFEGYGYPGWMYLISCTDEHGRPKPIDEHFLADLRDRSRYGRQTTRHAQDLRIRAMLKEQDRARRHGYWLSAEDAWDEARDYVKRSITDRKVIAAPSRRSG